LLTPADTFPEEPERRGEHGIEIVRSSDGVDLIDTWSLARPSLHLSHAEYDAFVAGVLHGDFDFSDPSAAERIVQQGTDAGEPMG
jgi:hypothetical protein